MDCSGSDQSDQGVDCNTEAFNQQDLKAIVSYSKGVPRVLSSICNTSLLFGDKKGINIIDEDTIMKAINDVEL